MATTRRTGTERIENRRQRQVTFTKRHQGLFEKASKLSKLTDSTISIIVRFFTGRICYVSYTSGKMVDSHCRGRERKVMPLREWEDDWVKIVCDSCTTEEDLKSLKAMYEACADGVSRRLEDWKNSNPSVEACADGDRDRFWTSGVNSAASSGSELTPDEPLNLSEDCMGDYDRGSLSTLPENFSALRFGSSGEQYDSNDFEGLADFCFLPNVQF